MKKLLALTAALTVAAGAASLPASAAYEHIPQSRVWDEEIEMFDAFDKGEIPTDVNGDGTFDLIDCLIYWAYTNRLDYNEEYKDTLEALGDLNGDGMEMWDDAEHLIRYYITTHHMSLKDFDPDTYAEYEQIYEVKHTGFVCHTPSVTTHSLVEGFIGQLKMDCSYLMAGYDIYCEYVDNGTLDPALNADGNCDLTDLPYFWAYSLNREVFSVNPADNSISENMDKDIFARAKAIYDALPESAPGGDWRFNFTNMYYYEHGNVTKDMITDEFFESVLEGASELELTRFVTEDYFSYVPQNDPYIDYDAKMFDREYNAFVDAVHNGEKSLPDTNDDGILNSLDSFNTYIFKCEQRAGVTDEQSILPKDVRNTFINDMDVNDNGLSGDMNDLEIIDLFISIEDKNEEEMDEICNNYMARLNEYAAQLASLKSLPPVKFSPDGQMSNMTDDDRTGDANNDGETDLADAIFIMQSLANPDKYELSALGRFKGDVYEAGGGITANDALAIQNRLLAIE